MVTRLPSVRKRRWLRRTVLLLLPVGLLPAQAAPSDQDDATITELERARFSQSIRLVQILALNNDPERAAPHLRFVVQAALRMPGDELEQDTGFRELLDVLVKTGEDAYSELLLPLLGHEDLKAALCVVQVFGTRGDNGYMPPLVLAALASSRSEIVHEALRHCPNRWDPDRHLELRARLRALLTAEDEEVKFHACFPLMHGFGDADAIAYLLEQTASEDRQRVLRALSWIGDSCNAHRPASAELLARLDPHLRAEDADLRRAAVDALGTYQGDGVIERLIPALADDVDIIAHEARIGLVHNQRDRAAVRQRLEEALRAGPDKRVEERLQEALDELDKMDAKTSDGS